MLWMACVIFIPVFSTSIGMLIAGEVLCGEFVALSLTGIFLSKPNRNNLSLPCNQAPHGEYSKRSAPRTLAK